MEIVKENRCLDVDTYYISEMHWYISNKTISKPNKDETIEVKRIVRILNKMFDDTLQAVFTSCGKWFILTEDHHLFYENKLFDKLRKNYESKKIVTFKMETFVYARYKIKLKLK